MTWCASALRVEVMAEFDDAQTFAPEPVAALGLSIDRELTSRVRELIRKRVEYEASAEAREASNERSAAWKRMQRATNPTWHERDKAQKRESKRRRREREEALRALGVVYVCA
jgi:hypothetical protein